MRSRSSHDNTKVAPIVLLILAGILLAVVMVASLMNSNKPLTYSSSAIHSATPTPTINCNNANTCTLTSTSTFKCTGTNTCSGTSIDSYNCTSPYSSCSRQITHNIGCPYGFLNCDDSIFCEAPLDCPPGYKCKINTRYPKQNKCVDVKP